MSFFPVRESQFPMLTGHYSQGLIGITISNVFREFCFPIDYMQFTHNFVLGTLAACFPDRHALCMKAWKLVGTIVRLETIQKL